MKFLVELEVKPTDGRGPIEQGDVFEHLRTYAFDESTSFELSLLEDDPDHERGGSDDYRTFQFHDVKVEVVP